MMVRKVLAYLNMSIYFALRHLRASLPRAKIIKGWYLWSNCQIKQNVFGLHLNPTFASHIETALVRGRWCLMFECWGDNVVRQRLQQRRRDCDHSVRQTNLSIVLQKLQLFPGCPDRHHPPFPGIPRSKGEHCAWQRRLKWPRWCDVTSGDYSGDDERVWGSVNPGSSALQVWAAGSCEGCRHYLKYKQAFIFTVKQVGKLMKKFKHTMVCWYAGTSIAVNMVDSNNTTFKTKFHQIINVEKNELISAALAAWATSPCGTSTHRPWSSCCRWISLWVQL